MLLFLVYLVGMVVNTCHVLEAWAPAGAVLDWNAIAQGPSSGLGCVVRSKTRQDERGGGYGGRIVLTPSRGLVLVPLRGASELGVLYRGVVNRFTKCCLAL